MEKNIYKINLSYINSVTNGDSTMIEELVEIFLEQINEFSSNFLDMFNDKDWKNLNILAHKAKTSVLIFGLEELSNDYFKKLEFYSKHFRLKQIESLNSYIDKIELEKNLLETQIRCYFEEEKLDSELITLEEVGLLIADINKHLNKIKKEVTYLTKYMYANN